MRGPKVIPPPARCADGHAGPGQGQTGGANAGGSWPAVEHGAGGSTDRPPNRPPRPTDRPAKGPIVAPLPGQPLRAGNASPTSNRDIVIAPHPDGSGHHEPLQHGGSNQSGKPPPPAHGGHDAQFLGKPDPWSRCPRAVRSMVSVQNMRHPVCEHPRIARRSGDHLIALCDIRIHRPGKGVHLAGGRDVNPGQPLVDHLEGRTRPRLWPRVMNLGRKAGQHRAAPGEGIGGARGHHRQRARCRPMPPGRDHH